MNDARLSSLGQYFRHSGWNKYCVLPPLEQKVQHFTPGAAAGLEEAAAFRTNSWGIRGREFLAQDSRRILALGCSMTICQYIDQQKTWPAVLEQELQAHWKQPVWVGNLGKSTFTTRDILTVMKYFLPQIKEKLATLIVMVGANDMALMLSKQAGFDPDYRERAGVQRQLQRAFDQAPLLYSQNPVKTALHRAGSALKRSLRPSHWFGVEKDFLPQREKRENASGYINTLPDVSPGLWEYEKNLERIIELAVQRRLELVFLTVPTLWKTQMSSEEDAALWFGWISGSDQYYSSAVLAQAMDCYNESLRTVCARRNVLCLDAAVMVEKNLENFYDDAHLSSQGCQRLAGLICNCLSGAPGL